MNQASGKNDNVLGWDWFALDGTDAEHGEPDNLARSFAKCFTGRDGKDVLNHLRRTILERRLGPRASDAELRFLEGQRSVVAHMLAMIERGS